MTHEQHAELARLLNQAQGNLAAAARIVKMADFTDRVLYVGRTIQEWLIDPLRNDAYPNGSGAYQSVGYVGQYSRKNPPAKNCVPRR